MAILKFRVSLDEDETVYRDIAIKHSQLFSEFHLAILKSFDFDNKHQATFYRSNDSWARGREISVAEYDKNYVAKPLLMHETTIGAEIFDTNQKFIYEYDFDKQWIFLVELFNISKKDDDVLTYPAITRKEGIAPPQYGVKSYLGDKFTDLEEKYDIKETLDGFGTEGEGINMEE